MGSVLIHQCDVCEEVQQSAKLGSPPNSWFEFDYEYTVSRMPRTVPYLVCCFKCYIIMLDRCVHWSAEHGGNVRIAGMPLSFARKLVRGVNLQELLNDLRKKKGSNSYKRIEYKFTNDKFDDELEETEEAVNMNLELEEPLIETQMELIPMEVATQKSFQISNLDPTTPEPKGRIITIKVDSIDRLDWLEKFAEEVNCDKLMTKALSVWERDNIVTYDSLVDSLPPTTPLIRYKTYYSLFVCENIEPYFELRKEQNFITK